MLSIGLMSGTSMDGIDAALLETDGTEKQLIDQGHHSLHYQKSFKILLKSAEYAIRQTDGRLPEAEKIYHRALGSYLREEMQLPEKEFLSFLAEFGIPLPSLSEVISRSTALHAQVVQELLQKTGRSSQEVSVIGYHGQTFLHRPATHTSIILGDSQDLANRLGIPVVSQFRENDLAAGGQGAPFAPLYHQALALRDQKTPIAVLNCGGIANLTLILGPQEDQVFAFDTGPGNGLIDRLVKQRTQGREQMDENGTHGKQGQIQPSVLEALMERAVLQNGQNYLLKKPPKALDIGDLHLISELDSLSLEDACATLEAFTAQTIAKSLHFLTETPPSLWVLAGGGWKNPVIRKQLEIEIRKIAKHPVQIRLADEIGWNSQAMEAQIFAYLAVRSLQNKALSLPSTTGVPYPMTGGKSYFPIL